MRVSTQQLSNPGAALLALLLTLPLAGAAAAQRPPSSRGIAPSALQQIVSLQAEKASRSPAQRKISSRLLFEIKRQRKDPGLAGLPLPRWRAELDDEGRVLLDIRAEVSDALLDRIAALGGLVLNHHERYDAVHARLPLGRLELLAARGDVRSIRPAAIPFTRGNTTITEGDVAHKVNLARAAAGVDGTGVKVCAISDSVDELADLQGTGELPMDVDVLPGQSGNPGTSEGTALLEIIHDLAPGADLGFASGFTGFAQMAQNILDLEAAGCNVIVDDVGYVPTSVFQDDVIAQAVDEVAGKGVLYFSAVGNSGNKSNGTSGVFEGDFSGTALPPALNGLPGTAHNFGGGQTGNFVSEAFGPSPFFTLHWSDPHGASDNDYDLYLLNAAQTIVLDSSTDPQDGDDLPEEFISSSGDDDSGLPLVVFKSNGAAGRFFHLNVHGGRLGTNTDGQIFGHPAAAGAIGVAAVRVTDAGGPGGVFDGSESVEEFSSDGPRRIYFDAGGSPVGLTAGGPEPRGGGQSFIERQKPDVAAADGVSTTSSNFTTFFGTSAAAPHAAGISGLLLENLNNALEAELGASGLPFISSVHQQRGLFFDSSLDIESFGIDEVSGAGLLDALNSIQNNEIFSDGFESGNTASWTSQDP